MTTMTDITRLTEAYSIRHDNLASTLRRIEEEIRAVRSKHLDTLKQKVRATAEAHSALHAAIESAPELFEKPRTQVIAGIKVGMTKQRGKIEITDERATITRIRKLLPEDQAELLVNVKESVDKQAAMTLTAADLKRLGIHVTDDVDAVYIRPTDSDIDKLVEKLLNEAAREEDAA